jgi:hypothetical protein
LEGSPYGTKQLQNKYTATALQAASRIMEEIVF